ncbi:MAG TPA: MMPL family transporter [Candidatus Binataceae bacterium]|nr:MMPL family transporter [Candidatus Binataceae bacterium]
MAGASSNHEPWGVGKYVLQYRAPIGLVLIGVTAFLFYWATRVQIATKFENFFPAQHENTELYRKYQYRYGGAQTLAMMLRVKDGDIFNFSTLGKISALQSEINQLPGVDHNEIFSLASYRVTYAKVLPGTIVTLPFMYPSPPKTQTGLDQLRRLVRSHPEVAAGFVTYDEKGALIRASFSEEGLDYKELFDGINALVKKYSDANTEIFVAGQPVISGQGYYYLPTINMIFLLSIALMLSLLYLSLGQRSSWWAPILTGSFSAIWGLGFVSFMGYNFDPVMLVIPFILTARDLSHGIQWQGRYYDELDRLDDKLLACATTTDVMLPPGMLSIVADIAGIIFIAMGGIPVLKEIGFGGAVWFASSLTMVFIFQPIFMSYLPRPRIRDNWLSRIRARDKTGPFHTFINWLLGIPVTPGVLRGGLLLFGGIFIVWGMGSGLSARIGYKTPGTPLYRPDSKVNQDIAEIGKFFPTDEGWVIFETTEDYPKPQSTLAPAVLRAAEDLGDYLIGRGDALAAVSFNSVALEPMNQLFHNGYPKFHAVPGTPELAGNLWYMFLGGTAPGEMERFFAYSPHVINTCFRVFLPDHTYDRLNKLREDLKTFIDQRITPDPMLNHVTVRYLGGEAGLFAAANDVLKRLDFINITFVLVVIYICCAVTFRSPVAGMLFIISCVMANFGAFVYMNARDIGLTIDTIPVISLGIGLGVDYGIYAVARIQDEVINGATIEEAITTALHTTGAAVFSTFAVMVGGIIPWAFSPLLFHNEMSVLLIFLMATNMIAGLLILPAYISWRRPRFIARFEQKRTTKTAAA